MNKKMAEKFLIAGNWKMFKTVEESVDFVGTLQDKLNTLPHTPEVDVLVFPPFTSLHPVKNVANGTVKVGAQNMHFEEKGAFTGEISPLMLDNLVDYVLIGHSERRVVFKEQDVHLNKKVKTALNFGFTPVLCIGESLEEREAGNTFSRIEQQLTDDLEGLTPEDIEKIVIAYEPIWAIGTGKTATPEQAQEVHQFIRKILSKKINNPTVAESLKILYGGSVKPNNSRDILSQKDINGVLIGGASLKIDDFFAIIHLSYELANG
jgi:triosephosphate isomerase (TIM)